MPIISRSAVGSAKALGLNSSTEKHWVLSYTLGAGTNIDGQTIQVAGGKAYVSGNVNLSSVGLATKKTFLFSTTLNGYVDPTVAVFFGPTTNPFDYNTTIVDCKIDSANDLAYLLCTVETTATSAHVYVLIKYDLSTGTISLAKQGSITVPASTFVARSKIALTSDNNYLYVITSNGTTYYLSKVATSTFAVSWSRYLSGTVSLLDLTVDSSDNVYVAGQQTVSSLTSALLASWDSSGAVRWKKIDYPNNTTYYYRFTDISLTSDGSYVYGVGTKLDFFGGLHQVAIKHAASDGAYVSYNAYSSVLGETFNYIIPTPKVASASSINFIGANRLKYPDSVFNLYEDYALAFTAGTHITTEFKYAGVDTLAGNYLMPFSTGTTSSVGYIAALPADSQQRYGTYGSYTVLSASDRSVSASFSTTDSAQTSTTATVSFTTNYAMTASALTVTSTSLQRLP